MDPIATIPWPKGVHDDADADNNNNIKYNNNKKNCQLAVFFFFSSLCHYAKEVKENAGYQHDGFMTVADSFFPFVCLLHK